MTDDDQPGGANAYGGPVNFPPMRAVETVDGGPVFINQIDPGIPGVAELAKRLGVPAYESQPGGMSYVLLARDGKHYELIALIHAVLDRLDKAVPEGADGPTCKYCGKPVDEEGQVHAGGCGNIG